MPTIRGVEIIPDDGGGYRITLPNGTIKQYTSGSLAVSGTVQQVETAVNNFMVTEFANFSFNVVVHVFTTVPLVVQIATINKGLTLDPNWWQTRPG